MRGMLLLSNVKGGSGMNGKDLISPRCASCDGKGIPESLRPFCSVVCRLLGRAGLGWRTSPYRVVDLETGTVLSAGAQFNFTGAGIGDLQRRAVNLRLSAMELPTSLSAALTSTPIPPPVAGKLSVSGSERFL